jgi:hypothetical protein
MYVATIEIHIKLPHPLQKCLYHQNYCILVKEIDAYDFHLY